jgi:putative transposase
MKREKDISSTGLETVKERLVVPPIVRRVVALDPGVRTFQTAYDPTGVVIEVGKQDIQRIDRLCWHLDKLQSEEVRLKKDPDKKRRRQGLRRAMMRLRKRVRNLIDDVHKKLARFLVVNYTTILLPTFETQDMVKRTQRRITSKTARQMITWSHYRFQQHLLHKVRQAPWCQVEIVNESYTSKTCGCCGAIHDKLGSSKVFKCPSCQIIIDRDVNGARNILLKNMSVVDWNSVCVSARCGLAPW